MKLRRPDVRPPPETIIALIDVAFFLLAFFMLIGRMDATAPFEVVPPLALTGIDLPGGGITVSVSADGALALDGQPLARGDLAERVSDARSQQPARQIRVNAHQAAELRHVLPVISELEAQGLDDIVLVVSPDPQ